MCDVLAQISKVTLTVAIFVGFLGAFFTPGTPLALQKAAHDFDGAPLMESVLQSWENSGKDHLSHRVGVKLGHMAWMQGIFIFLKLLFCEWQFTEPNC